MSRPMIPVYNDQVIVAACDTKSGVPFYTLADLPTQEDLDELGLDNAEPIRAPRRVVAVYTGEFRKPKRGEWFISGAIPEAYRASLGVTSSYHIAKLRVVKFVKCAVPSE